MANQERKISPKLIIMAVGVVALIVAAAGKYVFHWTDSNPIEAEAEQIAKEDLGIDLTTTGTKTTVADVISSNTHIKK